MDLLPSAVRQWLEPAARGFTLLEVVVVLFIVGMITGIIAPRLPTMLDSLDYRLKRETIESAIGGLTYLAFRNNQDYVLSGTYDADGHRAEDAAQDPGDARKPRMPAAPVLSDRPGTVVDVLPITAIHPKLPLPPGWVLTAPEPIYFRESGFCKGGEVVLRVGRAEYKYVLSAPQCSMTAQE